MLGLYRRLLLIIVTVVVGASSIVWASPAGATSLPFTDPDANGYIGFCDGSNNNITSGDVNAAPFVWKAVSSTTPPSAYQGAGQNAILNVYQVRKDSDPVDWAGDSLTTASFYTDSKLPTVVFTTQDEPLSDFTKAYPPMEDGMYQLRMFYGRANYGLYSDKYPTAVISVKDGKWTVVQGGQVTCKSATATSQEVMLGVVPSADATPPPPKSTSQSSSSTSGSASSTASGAASISGTSAASAATDGQKTVAAGNATAKSASSSGSSALAIILAAVFVAVVVVGAVLLWRRRQRQMAAT
jgi:hypothetical protein